MKRTYRQAVNEVYEGSGRDLANEANAAFDRRIEAAKDLAAVLGIIKDTANGWYDYTTSKDPQSEERLQGRKTALEQEVRDANQAFDTYQLAAAVLMPSRGELETLETQVETPAPLTYSGPPWL
jgi:hypothetical protein